MFERWSNSLQEIPVTWGLVTLHLLLYLYTASVDPTFGTEALQRLGGQHNPLVWDGEYYRLLVSGFLHGGWFHFLLNNLALISLGRLLERLLGSAGYGLLYLLALLAGNIASLLWMPPAAVSVGASGAIMGLAGALCAFLVLDRKGRFLDARPSGRSLFFGLVLLQFLIGELFSFINNAAHIGGFLAGVCFGLYFWSRIPGVGFSRRLGVVVLWSCILTMGGLAFVGLTPQDRYAWHLHAGMTAFQGKDIKKADALATQAEKSLLLARKRQETPEVLLLLGELYLQRQQYARATPVFAKLVKQSPERIDFWFAWIRSLAKSGQSKAASRALLDAEKRFVTGKVKRPWWSFLMPQPDVPQALSHARLLVSALQDRKALLLYQRLLREHPTSSTLHNDYAWLLVTAHDPRFRSAKLAIDYALFAVQKSPNAAYLDTLAMAYFRDRQYAKAVETEQRAIDSPGAASTMPHLLLQLQRFTKALQATKPAKPAAKRNARSTTRSATKRSAKLNAKPTTKPAR